MFEAIDLLIAGAGPAGLSAAVNAASEGLSTLVVDKGEQVGGQAAYSARVENYPGFERGISGQKLVQRTAHQARKFGAQIKLSTSITKLIPEGELFIAVLSDGSSVVTRVLLVCCGLSWRKLQVPGEDRLLHKGVFYGAYPNEALNYSGRTVAIVGGANSALQAAVNFADHGALVHLLVRGDAAEGSKYLTDRTAQHPNITTHFNTEVSEFAGTEQLDRVLLKDGTALECGSAFIFIGGEPHTNWIAEHCACDDHGYLITDKTNMTSKPGIFAAGDVVSGSTKRIATASGMGAECVQHIHAYLATTLLS